MSKEKCLYYKHKKNHDEIVESYSHLENTLLLSIKQSDNIIKDEDVKIHNRLLTLLLGIYAETFLTSFIYESHYKTKIPYFEEEQIKNILDIKIEEDKWEYVIKYSMEKKYGELNR